MLGSAASFAVMPVFGKVAYAEGVSPIGLLAWRFGIAAVMLLVVLALRRNSTPLPDAAALTRLLLLGAVVLAGEVGLFFYGLQYLDAGLAEVLLFLFPAWVVVLTAIKRRTWPGALIAGCTALAVGGAALTVLGGSTLQAANAFDGVVLVLAASVVYAFYIIFSGRSVAAYGALVTTTAVVTGAAISLFAVAVIIDAPGPTTAVGFGVAVGIGVVSTVFAFGLLSLGLSLLPTSHAAVIATSEPVIAVVLGALLLGESVLAGQAAGVLLVVVSIAVILLSDVRKSEREELQPDSL
ncbi:MAG: DMT family transporter [Actinobacteria bacterium]|nr:DMT family transporter [Actinomycetota bacterium]MCB9412753.1 DMT family transporter [Actinomycetota bacterium]